MTHATTGLLSLLVAGVALAGPSAEFDHADFTGFRTFGVRPGSPERPDTPTGQRTEAAVIAGLLARGWTLSDDPDIWVVTRTASDRLPETSVGSIGFGGWYFWAGWAGSGWGSTTIRSVDLPVATLVVDCVRAGDDALIWRGIATRAAKRPADESPRRIEKAVGRALRDLPPPGR